MIVFKKQVYIVLSTDINMQLPAPYKRFTNVILIKERTDYSADRN